MKVIVFGSTGVIGTELCQILSREQPKWDVVAVTRSPTKNESRLKSLNLSNVQLVQGDVEDLDSVKELTKDVDLVYCTVGFKKYETKYWGEHWPKVVDNLLSVTSNARPLIFCDNLYAYGAQTDMTPSSDTVEPSLKSKPGIRATLRQNFVERMQKEHKSLCVVGACDFFGPHVTSNSFLGDVFLGNMIIKQQKPLVIGSGDNIHDFCFARDFSQALYNASLPSNHKKSMGKFWICPHSIHNKTLKQISDDVSGMLAIDSNKKISGVSAMPAWMVWLLGVFMPFMYEMRDMLPIWINDYSVEDSDFCETFGVQATPYEEALRETIVFFETLKKDDKQ